MSHIAFVAPPFQGHLDPMLALAAALVARGHRATFLGLSDLAGTWARPDIGFEPLGARSHPPGTLGRLVGHMARPGGLGLVRIMRDMTAMTRMLCDEMPNACLAGQVDAIVADQLEPAGALVAARLGLPYVTVANALPIRRDPLHPPPFVGWRFDPSPRGLGRNRGGYRVADLLMRPVSAAVAREARRFGLRRSSLESCLSPLADLTQLVPALDFPCGRPSPTVHPCGPLRETEDADVAWLRRDGRPLVFASLGTLQGGRVGLFRKIAEACRRLDLHLVIAHGGRLADGDAATLPGRPTVRAFVPQRAVLRHAALAVTNGGLNTVLDAAALGVPILVTPVAFEQAAIGARVEHAGIGRMLPRGRRSPSRIQAAMHHLLADADRPGRAAQVSQAIAAAGGVERAAGVVEAVLRTGRPVPATLAAERPLAVPA